MANLAMHASYSFMRRPGMAAARDQAARVIRVGQDTAEGDPVRDSSAVLAEQLRSSLAEDVVARRPAETPDKPAPEQPVVTAAAAADSAAAKPRKRKLILPGILALLALAGAGYGVHYFLVGRFFVGTDD